tara:strand:- start:140 stop:514 length:375 start_codon:yes stop_codon:yes gene_type:complete
MKAILITSFTALGDNQFKASGTIDGVAFAAQTITYRGEPIFKVQEQNEEGEVTRLTMKNSKFNRGQRIALARALKMERLRREENAGLDEKTLKQLRALAKERNVSGTHRKGITKAEVVELLKAS